MASPATGPADRGLLDAVVLAGGRGARLGGADKAALTIDGVTLLDRALAAVRGARRCVVVGPPSLSCRVPVVQEQPTYAGPAAGLAAGLEALGENPASAVVVLACDLADAENAVAALLTAWPPSDGADGLCLSYEGRPQWLAAIYRRAALDAAVAALGDPAGRPIRALVAPLALHEVAAGTAAADVDTWEDLGRAREKESP